MSVRLSRACSLAIFFIIWWMVLFAVLPFGLQTQDEDDDVTLGTVSSAPRGPHMLQVVIRTTHRCRSCCAASSTVLTQGLGYGFDDLPRIVPEFDCAMLERLLGTIPACEQSICRLGARRLRAQ